MSKQVRTAEDKVALIENRQNRIFDNFDRKALPDHITIGYIGNVNSDGTDDRLWCLFRNTGKVGTSSDSIGGYPTEERYKLLPLITAIIWSK